jgi:hypothetical protein
MTQEKNIELAKKASGTSRNYMLLITKEVFKINKVESQQEIDMINPFKINETELSKDLNSLYV